MTDITLQLKHYSRFDVKREIVDYCRFRWVAFEHPQTSGRRLFVRYFRDGRPLKIHSIADFDKIISEYGWRSVRTIYATANIYGDLSSQSLLDDPDNIRFTTPIWDIDGKLEQWKATLEAARVIVDFLEKHGIVKSVYLKWSGNGVHVHIHERAFSKELLEKYNPLDLAYSIVAYVNRMCRERIWDIVDRYGGVSVENLMDIKRVFTAPLSLHRRLDLCCVCFKPDQIDDFHPEWTNPSSFKHNPDWRIYEEGEADSLALIAYREVGGYPGWTKPRRSKLKEKPTRVKHESSEEVVEGRIGRFPVMALLQAARYYILTGDLEKAKSFGLNRAIFYAWAKYYGKDYVPKYRRGMPRIPGKRKYRFIRVVGEQVPVSENGWFIMGGVEQRPEDYDRQVASRINMVVPYEEAWKAALNYVKSFPRSILLDPQKFYEEVYKPVRDRFIEKVMKKKVKGGSGVEKTILDFLK